MQQMYCIDHTYDKKTKKTNAILLNDIFKFDLFFKNKIF